MTIIIFSSETITNFGILEFSLLIYILTYDACSDFRNFFFYIWRSLVKYPLSLQQLISYLYLLSRQLISRDCYCRINFLLVFQLSRTELELKPKIYITIIFFLLDGDRFSNQSLKVNYSLPAVCSCNQNHGIISSHVLNLKAVAVILSEY